MTQTMRRVLNAVDTISRISVWIGGGLLLAASVFIGIEVLLRKLFAISLSGATEISTYVLAMSTAFAFAYALFRKAHIRVDVLYSRLPARAQAVLDVLSLAMLLLFMAPLSYYAFGVFRTSLRRGATANTPLQTPLWIPQGLWWLGLVGFTAVIVLILVATVSYLLRGRLAEGQELAGATTLEEEIEEESGIRLEEEPRDR